MSFVNEHEVKEKLGAESYRALINAVEVKQVGLSLTAWKIMKSQRAGSCYLESERLVMQTAEGCGKAAEHLARYQHPA